MVNVVDMGFVEVKTWTNKVSKYLNITIQSPKKLRWNLLIHL